VSDKFAHVRTSLRVRPPHGERSPISGGLRNVSPSWLPALPAMRELRAAGTGSANLTGPYRESRRRCAFCVQRAIVPVRWRSVYSAGLCRPSVGVRATLLLPGVRAESADRGDDAGADLAFCLNGRGAMRRELGRLLVAWAWPSPARMGTRMRPNSE
jgi:hypothetical protein